MIAAPRTELSRGVDKGGGLGGLKPPRFLRLTR